MINVYKKISNVYVIKVRRRLIFSKKVPVPQKNYVCLNIKRFENQYTFKYIVNQESLPGVGVSLVSLGGHEMKILRIHEAFIKKRC